MYARALAAFEQAIRGLSAEKITAFVGVVRRAAGTTINSVDDIIAYVKNNPLQFMMILELSTEYLGNAASDIYHWFKADAPVAAEKVEKLGKNINKRLAEAQQKVASTRIGYGGETDLETIAAVGDTADVLKRVFGSLKVARVVQTALETFGDKEWALAEMLAAKRR